MVSNMSLALGIWKVFLLITPNYSLFYGLKQSEWCILLFNCVHLATQAKPTTLLVEQWNQPLHFLTSWGFDKFHIFNLFDTIILTLSRQCSIPYRVYRCIALITNAMVMLNNIFINQVLNSSLAPFQAH